MVLLEQGNCLEADSLSSGNPHSPTASLNWRDEDDIFGEDKKLQYPAHRIRNETAKQRMSSRHLQKSLFDS